MTESPASAPPADRVPRIYWLLGALVVAYVAICTGHRDNLWGTDGWEHHRAFKALAEDLWHPGNPTFAIDTPSARYTPYSVFWAIVCRATGMDPYRALSLAATANTAVLVLAVPFLLGRFGEAKAAASALIVMLSLYGGSPGTTNSYALADLPWHQVNFSAASFGWTLVLLGVYQAYAKGEWGAWSIPILIALSSLTLLDHGITGSWGQFSLWLLTAFAPKGRRLRLALTLILIQGAAALICLGWPWYNFVAALGGKAPSRIVPYGLQFLMSTHWCVPATALLVLAMVLRDRPAIPVFLVGGYLCYLAGWLVWILPIRFPLVSSVSRYPMHGLIYSHMALGILAHQAGLFRPTSWPGRFRTLLRGDRGGVAGAAGEVVLATAVIYFLIPQLYDVARSPHLMRPHLVKLAGRQDKQLNLMGRFRSLLVDVGPRDVILSDEYTMWCVPSVNGRIVHALHAELFVPEEEDSRRQQDTLRFFSPEANEGERVAMLGQYDVRWIILNRDFLPLAVFESLIREPAVVRKDGPLILMDANRWIEAGSKVPEAAATAGL